MTRVMSAKTAKEDLRPEYRFDYSKSKPNRFASGSKDDPTAANEAPGPETRVTRRHAVH